MGQYAEFRVKNTTLCLGYIYFLVFFVVFYHLHFFFLIKHQISATEY